MLRQRLGDEKMGLLNYGGSELLKENNIAALDEIGPVNHLLRNIFNLDTFIADERKINDFGFNRDVVKSLVFSPFESQIDTGVMMRSLIAMAQSKGVMIINNYDAAIVDDSSNTVKVSAKNSGVAFTSNRLISCSNAFTSSVLPQIKIKPGRGQVIATKPVTGLQIKGVFHMDEGYYYFRNY